MRVRSLVLSLLDGLAFSFKNLIDVRLTPGYQQFSFLPFSFYFLPFSIFYLLSFSLLSARLTCLSTDLSADRQDR